MKVGELVVAIPTNNLECASLIKRLEELLDTRHQAAEYLVKLIETPGSELPAACTHEYGLKESFGRGFAVIIMVPKAQVVTSHQQHLAAIDNDLSTIMAAATTYLTESREKLCNPKQNA